ncbi:MAG: rhodanese-like domain-containing protein [Actinomycetota bacterium]|nr:rhodanese-like domain-containing protein [Actinomycetota bacterium]
MKSISTTATSLLLVGALAFGACGGSTATDTNLETLPVGEIEEIVASPPADLILLDIRTPEEFAAGHLAGAINVDYYANDFEDRLAELNLEVPYVMYCNSGNRSSNALPVMDSLGFQEVYELDGGIQAWFSANLPIEQ